MRGIFQCDKTFWAAKTHHKISFSIAYLFPVFGCAVFLFCLKRIIKLLCRPRLLRQRFRLRSPPDSELQILQDRKSFSRQTSPSSNTSHLAQVVARPRCLAVSWRKRSQHAAGRMVCQCWCCSFRINKRFGVSWHVRLCSWKHACLWSRFGG